MFRTIRLSLAPVLVVALTVAASAGTISGNYLEARTCDVYTGPCFANSEFGLTGHQAILAWSIQSGIWKEVDLSGLSIVAAVRAGGTLGDEFTSPFPAKAVLIVDERATAEQKDALVGFARDSAGRLLDNVTRIDSAPIELTVNCCAEKGCSKLVAGKIATIQTRCTSEKDHVCGNETIYYQPLTAVKTGFVPAVTVTHEFKGQGLGGTWSSPNKRSAFVGSFSR